MNVPMRMYRYLCPVWQEWFHERVVPDEGEFLRIQAYILNNPRQSHLGGI